jgi:hypothetical protein
MEGASDGVEGGGDLGCVGGSGWRCIELRQRWRRRGGGSAWSGERRAVAWPLRAVDGGEPGGCQSCAPTIKVAVVEVPTSQYIFVDSMLEHVDENVNPSSAHELSVSDYPKHTSIWNLLRL